MSLALIDVCCPNCSQARDVEIVGPPLKLVCSACDCEITREDVCEAIDRYELVLMLLDAPKRQPRKRRRAAAR